MGTAVTDETTRRTFEIPPGAIERAKRDAAHELAERSRTQLHRSIVALEADGEEVCRSCSTPLIWTIHDGHHVPIEREPDPQGTVGVSPYDGSFVFGLERAKPDQLTLTDEPAVRYRLHFETCPDRDKWREWGARRRATEQKGGHE